MVVKVPIKSELFSVHFGLVSMWSQFQLDSLLVTSKPSRAVQALVHLGDRLGQEDLEEIHLA